MGMEPAELAQWFSAYGSKLILYARQWLPPALAEDAVQDVFLSLMAQRQPPAQIRAWLFCSVRNAAISASRSNRRRRKREEEVAQDRGEWFSSSPHDLIDATVAQEALSRLPDPQREIVVLRIWGELTLAEIGQTMALPISTIHDHYRTALAHLRACLEHPCSRKHP